MKNFFLDLDHTIICSETLEDLKKYENYKDKMKKYKYKNMDDCYIVFERPNLQSFLDFLFKNYNVSIWTAASKDYALFIIEHFVINKKKNRKLDWIFFSKHCKISTKLTDNTKNLSVLWNTYKIKNYKKNNTVILDDYDEVYNTQRSNCILAKPFKFSEDNSHKDTFLNDLTKQLKLKKKVSKINSEL